MTGRVLLALAPVSRADAGTPPAHIAPRDTQRAVGFGGGLREMVGSLRAWVSPQVDVLRCSVALRRVCAPACRLADPLLLQLLVEEFGAPAVCPMGCRRAELPADFCQRKGLFGVRSGSAAAVMIRVRPLPLH